MLRLKVKAKGLGAVDLSDILGHVKQRVLDGITTDSGKGWDYTVTVKRQPPRPAALTLSIETENAAFDGRRARCLEVARILRRLADEIDRERSAGGKLSGLDGQYLRDVNGNAVGKVKVRSPKKARK